MKTFWILGAVVIGLLGAIGCGSDAGDIERAARAAAAAPKSVDELPADMPPQAKASAASEMGKAAVIQEQMNDPARKRAMQEMQKQR